MENRLGFSYSFLVGDEWDNKKSREVSCDRQPL